MISILYIFFLLRNTKTVMLPQNFTILYKYYSLHESLL